MKKTIEIDSYNPYEKHFPNRKLVNIETLKLMKFLRQNEIDVIVKPKDGRPVEYLFHKGVSEWFNDPVFMAAFNFTTPIVGTLIANFIQKLIDKNKNTISSNASSNIFIVNTSDNTIKSLNNRNLSHGERRDLDTKRQTKAKEFEKCLDEKSPYHNLPTPIFYEHKPKIIGWCRLLVDDIGIKIEDSHVVDKNIYRKIKEGKIKGGSLTGIAEKTKCNICSKSYIDCEHISGEEYEGISCTNSILKSTHIEFSLVKKPVNEQAIISIVENQRH